MNASRSCLLDRLNGGAPASGTVFTYLDHFGREQRTLSWNALGSEARAIAANLQRHRGRPACALLMHPPGLDFVTAFLGCLLAGVAAVPACIPRTPHQRRFLRAVGGETRPGLILSTAGALDAEGAALDSVPNLSDARRVATDEIDPGDARYWRDPEPSGDDTAYVQFTSGSAGDPRGVVVTHDNLRWNSECLTERFEHAADSVMVSWLPTFHDMGLLYSVLEPVIGGFSCVLMSPWSFLRRPAVWLEAISRYRGTHSAAPNFAYELCLRRTSREERQQLDLGCWRVAMNAAEPVRWDTMQRFAAAFEGGGFRWSSFNPSYGLAESTVMVSGCQVGSPPRRRRSLTGPDLPESGGGRHKARQAVSVGPSARETRVTVVDPETRRPLADGQIGEIWITGPLVCRGYWNRPLETAATFHASIAGQAGRYLRTGDLGFIAERELHITGRCKDVIIVGGGNHYPQDIEYSVERSHPAVRAGSTIAFSIDNGHEEEVIVVTVVGPVGRPESSRSTPAEIERTIRAAVARDHEIGVHTVAFVCPSELPRTSSGKLQRGVCRRRYEEGTLSCVWETPRRRARP